MLELISADTSISQSEIAKRLGVNRRTINRYLGILRQTHKIEWTGSAKNGFWKIEKNDF
ncbi:MAG: HTH domain-containing protein [Muribaculaceae bacterium]|nr:HTH domain-containing protein [Muribaculaceae bacterium]